MIYAYAAREESENITEKLYCVNVVTDGGERGENKMGVREVGAGGGMSVVGCEEIQI